MKWNSERETCNGGGKDVSNRYYNCSFRISECESAEVSRKRIKANGSKWTWNLDDRTNCTQCDEDSDDCDPSCRPAILLEITLCLFDFFRHGKILPFFYGATPFIDKSSESLRKHRLHLSLRRRASCAKSLACHCRAGCCELHCLPQLHLVE